MIIVVRLTANAAGQFPCKWIPLIRCLPVRCVPCRNSLRQLPCLFIHDCRKAVFYQIFRQFSVVSDLLMCDRICNECLLKQAITAVFLISDNVLNGGLRPGSTRHSGRHFIGNFTWIYNKKVDKYDKIEDRKRRNKKCLQKIRNTPRNISKQ